MKKLITAASVSAMIGFAVVLANANDVSSENPNDAQTYDSQSTLESSRGSMDRMLDQSPGQAADINNQGSLPPPPTLNPSLKVTCTDANGVTFKSGDFGYRNCVNIKKLQAKNADDDQD